MATIPPNNQTPTGQDWYPGRITLGKTQKNKEKHFPPVQQLEKEGEWTRWSRENPVQSEPPPPTQSQYWAEEPSSSESNNYRGSEFDPVQGPFPYWRGSPPTPLEKPGGGFCTATGWI